MPNPMAPPIKIVADETYGLMLKTLIQTNESIAGQISANYAMVDYAFMQRLDAALADTSNDAALNARLTEIKQATNEEMAMRMQTAAETLRDILTSPSAVVMEGKLNGLVRQGKLDNALFELLQANLEQAEAAGDAGSNAVRALGSLKARVRTEVDKTLQPAPRLLRRLLRMEDAAARQALLKEKMRPKQQASVILTDASGKEQEPEDTKPDVPPKVFAEAITEIKLRFGNVDEDYDSGFVSKLQLIADEAEAVALDLAGGKELSSRQQQDMMWQKGAVSVWDLEQVEEEAHQDGNWAMWEQEAQDQMAAQESRKNAARKDFGGGLQL